MSLRIASGSVLHGSHIVTIEFEINPPRGSSIQMCFDMRRTPRGVITWYVCSLAHLNSCYLYICLSVAQSLCETNLFNKPPQNPNHVHVHALCRTPPPARNITWQISPLINFPPQTYSKKEAIMTIPSHPIRNPDKPPP